MTQVARIDRTATRTLTGIIAGMVIAIPLLLSGCGAAAPSSPFEPTLLVIRDDAASGPDFLAEGSIEHAGDAAWFELRLRVSFTSVIVMTTGATDTAGAVTTADRIPIAEMCGEEPSRPCIYSYDADIAHNGERSDAFNAMQPSENFVWEGNLPGPEGDEEHRTYYIRVTGEGGATGSFVLTVELNAGKGPMYT